MVREVQTGPGNKEHHEEQPYWASRPEGGVSRAQPADEPFLEVLFANNKYSVGLSGNILVNSCWLVWTCEEPPPLGRQVEECGYLPLNMHGGMPGN